MLALGAGAGETGLLQTAQTLPFLLLAIPAGVLADRMSRRRLMASAETLRVGSLTGICALAGLGGLTWPLLALFGFIGACGTVAYSVAAPALVPALVPPRGLAAANGRIELARTVAFAAGPALGGALVGWTGGAPAFGIAAALSTVAVFCLAGLREPARPTLPARHPLLEIREGAGFVFSHRLLRPVYVTQVIFNMAFFRPPGRVRALRGAEARLLGIRGGRYAWNLRCRHGGRRRRRRSDHACAAFREPSSLLGRLPDSPLPS